MKPDRKLDRNADIHQRTIANIHEHEVTPEATGGIPTNSYKQRSSYPPSDPYAITACHKAGSSQNMVQLCEEPTAVEQP